MSARDELAAAVNTVAGVTCKPYPNQNLAPGQGFVRRGLRAPDASGLPGAWLDTWEVWIALSQDIASAEKRLDELLDDLAAALRPHLHLTAITPSELVVGASSVPGVILAGVRAD